MLRTAYLRMPAILLGIAVGTCLFAQTAPRVDSFDGRKAGEGRAVAGVRLCWAPPGHFRMGSPTEEPVRRADEGPVEVTLTRSFWIGKYEVTQGQWKAAGLTFPREREMNKGEGADFPAYWVSYLEAEDFCRRLTKRANDSGELPQNWKFTLPTEAQWEYAYRAGTTTATPYGDRLSSLQANFNGNAYNGAEEGPSRREATKVGSFPANPWGLHDMAGNVWEWCRDWYHWSLPGGIDPDLSETKGMINRDGTYSRVRRGGAWIEEGWTCRSACRLKFEPDRRSDHIGFRVVVVRY